MKKLKLSFLRLSKTLTFSDAQQMTFFCNFRSSPSGRQCVLLTHVYVLVAKLIKNNSKSEDKRRSAMFFNIQEIQKNDFQEIHSLLIADVELPRSKNLALILNPFIDIDGFIRVGGHLHHGDLPNQEKHPVLLPLDSSNYHWIGGDSGAVTTGFVILQYFHELSIIKFDM